MNPSDTVVRFTNCVQALDGDEVTKDLYLSTSTGKIIPPPPQDEEATAVHDLGGCILAPGLIEVQLNGALGFTFSDVPGSDAEMEAYVKGYQETCQGLIRTGVTSFLPTLTTMESESFKRALPHVASNGHLRDPSLGTESLGAHCEGPFISAARKGAHDQKHLRVPVNGLSTIEEFYGLENLQSRSVPRFHCLPAAIKKITVAPEIPGMLDTIRDLTTAYPHVCCSIGHTAATYEQALQAVHAGATMVTHLFNAMEPLLHRSPGVVGLLGAAEDRLPSSSRPLFGLIADDVHVSPSCVRTAWAVHEDGCILTTDGTAATGLDWPDGLHETRSGRRVVKQGRKMFLQGTDTIAGGTTTLLQCVSNLIRWTGIGVGRALKPVTANPARLLGLSGQKGSLHPGADADLLVLSWGTVDGNVRELQVDQVWKFGTKVYDRDDDA